MGRIKLVNIYRILLEGCAIPQNTPAVSEKKSENAVAQIAPGVSTEIPFDLRHRNNIREFCRLYKNVEAFPTNLYRASSSNRVKKIRGQLEKLVVFAEEKGIIGQPIVKDKLSNIRRSINDRKEQDILIINEYCDHELTDQLPPAGKLGWLEKHGNIGKKLAAYLSLAGTWGNREVLARVKSLHELHESIPDRKARIAQIIPKYRDFVEEFRDFDLDLDSYKNINKFYEIALDYARELEFKEGDEYFLLKRFKRMPSYENKAGLTGLFVSAILNHNQVEQVDINKLSGSLWLFKANNMQIRIMENNGARVLAYIENCGVEIGKNNSDAGFAAKKCKFHVKNNHSALLKNAEGCEAVIDELCRDLPKTSDCKFYIGNSTSDFGLDSRVYLKQEDGTYVNIEKAYLKFEFWKKIYEIFVGERGSVQKYISAISYQQYKCQALLKGLFWNTTKPHTIIFSQLNIKDNGEELKIGSGLHELAGKKVLEVSFSEEERQRIKQDYKLYKEYAKLLNRRDLDITAHLRAYGSLVLRQRFNPADASILIKYETLAKSAEAFIRNAPFDLSSPFVKSARIASALKTGDFNDHYKKFQEKQGLYRLSFF